MIRSFVIATIPHARQRYETVGDWEINGQCLNVHVSDLGDWRMNACIAVHEIAEALLCVHDGVREEDVSAFDEGYEAARKATVSQITDEELKRFYEKEGRFKCSCIPTSTSEPGEDVHAPYRKQHALADVVERLLALTLGLSWADYNAKVEAL